MTAEPSASGSEDGHQPPVSVSVRKRGSGASGRSTVSQPRSVHQQQASELSSLCFVWKQAWPFDTAAANVNRIAEPSIWQYLLSDRYVLGFVRLALVALALYVVLSVPALVIAARWAKGIGSHGVAADEAEEATKTLEDYEEELSHVTQQLEAANAAIDDISKQRDAALGILRGLTRSSTSPLGTPGSAVRGRILGEEGGDDDDAGRHPDADNAERRGADAAGAADG